MGKHPRAVQEHERQVVRTDDHHARGEEGLAAAGQQCHDHHEADRHGEGDLHGERPHGCPAGKDAGRPVSLMTSQVSGKIRIPARKSTTTALAVDTHGAAAVATSQRTAETSCPWKPPE